MARERRTEWLVLVVLVGFVVAFVASYVMTQYVLRGYPYSTFLFAPSDTSFFQPPINEPSVIGVHYFGDFFEAWANSRGPRPYVGFPLVSPSSYFPVTHIVLFPLAQLPFTTALTIYLGGFTAVFGALVFRQAAGDALARTRAAFVLTACSTPVLFLVDRGNIEGLLFLMLVAALLAYRRERFYLAALLLAVPVAMKGSPGVFWLLFLFDGQIRALVASVVACLAGTFVALSVLPGSTGANLHSLHKAVQTLTTAAGSGTFGLRQTVSLKGAFTVLGHANEKFNFFVVHYAFVAVAVLIGVALALALLRPVFWQRVALVSAAMIVVPTVSYEYRMIHIFLPLLLFLARPEQRRSDPLFVALFGLLLIPKGLPILFGDVNLGVLVNPLLLAVLMIAVVIDAARTGGVALWRPGAERAAPAGSAARSAGLDGSGA